MKQARILILRGGALGDFIVTLPALRALRQRWPDAWIELIGYPHVASLARLGGLADRVDSLDRAGIARLFALNARLDDELAMRLACFDIVINYLHDPDGTVMENLRRNEIRTLIHQSPLVERQHAVDHFLKPLESLAIYAEDRAPRLDVAAKRDPALAVLHPGSGSPRKNWPAERYLHLAQELESAGRTVVFCLGEADEAAARVVDPVWPADRVWRHPPIEELARRLASAGLYVGNDSGVSHLAAAVGTPVVALFGPSNPDLWAPRGPHVEILRAPNGILDALDADTVLAASARIARVA